MKKFYVLCLLGVMVFLGGCGEPSESEMKSKIVEVLKQNKQFSNEFVESIDIKYGNGVLIFNNNCPALIKQHDKELSKIYKKKEKQRKNDVWGSLLAVGMGDDIWTQSIKYRDECKDMLYRAALLSETLDGVKEVRVME